MQIEVGAWWNWLNANIADPNSPIAFRASSACALVSIGVLIQAVQSQYRLFARELIAFAMDWGDRDRLWATVTAGRFDIGRIQ